MANNESALRYFWNDLTNKSLIITKFIWFTILFGVVMIWPFISLHMTSLGLSEGDVGIASALSAALTIMCPFMFGFIADKIGNFKLLVSGLTLVTGVVCLLFTVIPSTTSSTTGTSSNITTNVSLSEQDNVTLAEQDKDNYATTFWSYLIVRIMFVLSQTGSYTLYDGAVMSYMQEHNLDYGMQKAWGTLAIGVSPFVGAVLKDMQGMQGLFCVSAAFHFLTTAALLFVDLEFKKPAKSLWKDIFTQFIKTEIIMLFLSMITVGAIIGYIETYLYIFLFGMGASSTLLATAVGTGVPVEVIIQICATAIVAKVGHVNSINIGLFSLFIRTLGLSFVTNPWWALPFQMLEAFTSGLFWTTAMMYCTQLVTLKSLASFRGLLGIAYWGIGRLLGTSIGTIIREHFGDRNTFRVMSGVALATTIIYLIANQILKKVRSQQHTLEVTSQITTTERETEKGIDNPALIYPDSRNREGHC
ncbi:unnamed protein product [Meganyctiphanes norvegica]|uniref:Major facilitator superfamily associated domain-containing protein n=1 Tax=Meganyctiphanes norvegica TaxID=48144 RepID=A0AAV2PJP4_MEGNR